MTEQTDGARVHGSPVVTGGYAAPPPRSAPSRGALALAALPTTDPAAPPGPVALPAAVRATGRRLLFAWPLLAAVGLSLGLVVVQALRIKSGAGFSFFEADGQRTLTMYNRLAALLTYTAPDRQLLLPVLGLGAVAWLLAQRPQAVDISDSAGSVRAGKVAIGLGVVLGLLAVAILVMLGYLAVAAPPVDDQVMYLGPGRLQELGGPFVNAVLVLVLSVLLIRVHLQLLVAGAQPPAEATADEAELSLLHAELAALRDDLTVLQGSLVPAKDGSHEPGGVQVHRSTRRPDPGSDERHSSSARGVSRLIAEQRHAEDPYALYRRPAP